MTVLLRPAGISAELQEQLVHGGGCAEGDGQVPQQHATDFGRHQAAQQATGDAVRLPVAREDLHALRRIVSPLFSEFSLFVVPTDISILFSTPFPCPKTPNSRVFQHSNNALHTGYVSYMWQFCSIISKFLITQCCLLLRS